MSAFAALCEAERPSRERQRSRPRKVVTDPAEAERALMAWAGVKGAA